MQRHCHDGRSKKSVRLSPSVEALESRTLLSGPGPGTQPVPDNGMALVPRPYAATEVIEAHKVVAFQFRFAVDGSLLPTGDIQQFSLETAAGSEKLHRSSSAPRGVPLASVTYDQADLTLTLTPTAPAPVRKYYLMIQDTLFGFGSPSPQVDWRAPVAPTNPHPSHGSGFQWAALDPLVWPAALLMR
jgi:hypothetical protein